MRRAITVAVLALALLVPVAGAQAAGIPLSGMVAEPLDTTQAGAQTRFHFHVNLGGDDHIKDFTTRLPLGLAFNTDTTQCTQAQFDAGDDTNCPASSQVGTTTVKLHLELGVSVPETVNGRIYFLEPPSGGGLPRLGILLKPSPPAEPQRQIGEARINPQLGVFETVIENFPTNANGIPIRINSLDIILAQAFIKNPLTCGTKTSNFLITSYEEPNTTSIGGASYNVTGCAPDRPSGACDTKLLTLAGTAGRDVIRGTPRRDVINGFGGNDVIRGLGAGDILCGGKGNDQVFGGAGRDKLIGGPGVDTLRGGAGRDKLIGGPGKDRERQ
jgi:hypothetical protein